MKSGLLSRRSCLCWGLAAPLSLLLLGPRTWAAQAQDSGAARGVVALAQWDFMLGQWDLAVKPKASGVAAMLHGTPKLVGTWKASRSADGRGIDDELHILDGSGNPVSTTRTERRFDVASQNWRVSTQDLQRQRTSQASARWSEGQMLQTSRGLNNEGKAMQLRTRFFDIGADRFRVQQDRSLDDGASWDEATLTIVAQRSGKAAKP